MTSPEGEQSDRPSAVAIGDDRFPEPANRMGGDGTVGELPSFERESIELINT